jgi:hypothetical protein
LASLLFEKASSRCFGFALPNSQTRQAVHASGDNGPGRALEQSEQFLGYEARPRSVEVTIALRIRAVDEKALRHDRPIAAPGMVRPLRFLQIIEIAAAYFRVWIHETGFAVQSMSSKGSARRQPKDPEIQAL